MEKVIGAHMHLGVNAGFLLIACVGLLAFASVGLSAAEASDAPAKIIALEREALDRWGKGDPDGFLDISDASVVYFDPFVPVRVNGKDELRKLYNGIRGKIFMDSYEMLDPKVQVIGDAAILTFNFVSYGSEGAMRWNTTEVYQNRDGKWRIIHTHWSLTQPKLAP